MNLNRAQAVGIYHIAMGSPTDAELEVSQDDNELMIEVNSVSSPRTDALWAVGRRGERRILRSGPPLEGER